MRTDEELRADVMERLDAIPAIRASDIGVDVAGGQVTLNGQVDDHQTRFHVERVVRKVAGVRALVVHIDAH